MKVKIDNVGFLSRKLELSTGTLTVSEEGNDFRLHIDEINSPGIKSISIHPNLNFKITLTDFIFNIKRVSDDGKRSFLLLTKDKDGEEVEIVRIPLI